MYVGMQCKVAIGEELRDMIHETIHNSWCKREGYTYSHQYPNIKQMERLPQSLSMYKYKVKGKCPNPHQYILAYQSYITYVN